jgi:hypothetical protein
VSHFASVVIRGQLDVSEYRDPLFPGVIVATTVCDFGHQTAFVLHADDVKLEIIRAEWVDVEHWFASADYNSVRELD